MTTGKEKIMSNSDMLNVARGSCCYSVTILGTFNCAFEVVKRIDEVSEG